MKKTYLKATRAKAGSLANLVREDRPAAQSSLTAERLQQAYVAAIPSSQRDRSRVAGDGAHASGAATSNPPSFAPDDAVGGSNPSVDRADEPLAPSSPARPAPEAAGSGAGPNSITGKARRGRAGAPGGVPGYAEMLDALADPKHRRHKEVLEWVGGEFDPEAFDPEAASRALQRLR